MHKGVEKFRACNVFGVFSSANYVVSWEGIHFEMPYTLCNFRLPQFKK